MIINSQGLSLQIFRNILDNSVAEMKTNLGNDFTLRAEGVIDNIIITTSLLLNNLEHQMAYLAKQFDPQTAEGEYQDALYERVGLYRKNAVPTKFTLIVTGTPNTQIDEGSIYVQNKHNSEFFMNKSSFTFDEFGNCNVEFVSFVNSEISISAEDEFKIVTRPYNVNLADFSTIDNIEIGRSRETDLEFLKRFYSKLSHPEKCTRNAIIKNLSKYTDGGKFVSVIDSNSDENIPAGSILIIAKPSISDEDFGKLILNNVTGGLEYLGNTSVTTELSNGQTWTVSFQKPQAVDIELSANVKLMDGFYQYPVFNNIKDNVLSYFNEQILDLKSTVWATEFIIPMAEIIGVEAVVEISVKRKDSLIYGDFVEFARDEYPALSSNDINLIQV